MPAFYLYNTRVLRNEHEDNEFVCHENIEHELLNYQKMIKGHADGYEMGLIHLMTIRFILLELFITVYIYM